MDDLFDDQGGGKAKSVDYGELCGRLVYRAKVVLRRYWWILPLAVGIGIGVKVLELQTKEPYFASSGEMIVSGRISLPEEDVYAEEGDNFFGTQIELMRGGQVKSKAVDQVKLEHPDVYEAFTETEAYKENGLRSIKLTAEVKRDTSIFVLTAHTPHPEFSRRYLNAVMDSYTAFRRNMREETSEKSYRAVAEQSRQLEKEIDEREEAIVEFQKKNNMGFIQEQGSAAGNYLAELKRDLAELRTEQRVLDAVVREKGSLDGLIDDGTEAVPGGGGDGGNGDGGNLEEVGDERVLEAIAGTEDSEQYLETMERLEKLRLELSEFSIYLKPKHPKIINLKNEIERTENQLEIRRDQLVERFRERRRAVKNRIGNLEKEVDVWEKTALDNSRLLAEFERLESRLERSKEAYERNQESLRAIESTQNLEQESISVLQRAEGSRSAGPSMNRALLEGALFGGVLGGGLLFLIGALDNRIFTMEDAQARFDEPILGAIPFEAGRKRTTDSILLGENDERYVFAEACRNLRTSVFFMGDAEARPRVFAITSAIPSEGKSTVAANLSIALSFARSKVLLIDGDLRRGRLHNVFNTSRENGLSDVLEGEARLVDAIRGTGYANMDFLPVGFSVGQPGELFMLESMDQLIAEARELYDFVIFDSAPILAADDTTNFVGKVDRVFFTVRCGYTRAREVTAALGRLHDRQVGVGGLILNCLDVSQPGYYYYQYSEYYASSDGPKNRSRSKKGEEKQSGEAVAPVSTG